MKTQSAALVAAKSNQLALLKRFCVVPAEIIHHENLQPKEQWFYYDLFHNAIVYKHFEIAKWIAENCLAMFYQKKRRPLKFRTQQDKQNLDPMGLLIVDVVERTRFPATFGTLMVYAAQMENVKLFKSGLKKLDNVRQFDTNNIDIGGGRWRRWKQT